MPLIVGDSGNQDISYLNQYDNIIILSGDEVTAHELAKVIRRLIDSPSLRVAMSAGAEKVADEWLNWNKLILKTLRFN